MRIFILFIAILFHATTISQISKPKMVIAVVVDQMKYEYVYRFWDDFGQKGFKKLINQGTFCRNTHYNYVPTYTGPGHASIFTGTTPAVHGIIGNSWYSRDSLKPVYCAGDWKAQTICLCQKPHDKLNKGDGNMSPRNLLSTTIGDQLKIVDTSSKVFGVSLKDRGSILSAGFSANGAYWMNSTGNWITSDYYRNSIPNWVKQFEELNPVSNYMNSFWSGSTFNINLKDKLDQRGPSAIKSTPKGNQILWDFSKQLILNESLGSDEHTDLLVVGFSATDYIGHQFGPDAEQTKDTYLKLDQTIADMLLFFDKQFGKKNYTIMLTSDHGAATSPDVMRKMKFNGGRFDSRKLLLELNNYLFDVFGQDQLVSKEINMQFYLNFDIINSAGIEVDLLFQKIKDFLESKEFIKSVYDFRFNYFSINEKEVEMIKNGYHPKRSGDLFYVLNPGYLEWSRETGTTHASQYNYDTHVPLIFYGNGVQRKKLIDKRVHISDIAPTLSIIMKTSFPSGCTGNPIEDVISEN